MNIISTPADPPGARLTEALWTLVRSASAEGRLDPFVAFCALFVLRHADELEAEDEAEAIFDGVPFRPSLTVGVRWRELCRMEPSHLQVALRDIAALLIGDEDRGPGALTRRVLPALSRTHVDDRVAAFALVRDLTLDSLFARHAALGALDAVLFSSPAHYVSREWTPPPLARWMVDLADPAPTARVYDPCFGFGTLLVEVVRRRAIAAMESPRDAPQTASRIVGVELSPSAFAIGLARVILAGEVRPSLELDDALARPLPSSVAQGFDTILLDVPFGARRDPGAPSVAEFQTPSVEALFLQHAMANLRPHGNAVMVTPAGLTFQPGALIDVRRALLSRFRVDAIYELPAEAVTSDATVSTVALRFSHETPGGTVPVFRLRSVEGKVEAGTPATLFSKSSLLTEVRTLSVRDLLDSDGALRTPLAVGAAGRSRVAPGGAARPEDLARLTLTLGESVERRRLGEFVSIQRLDPERISSPNLSDEVPLVTAADLRDGTVVIDPANRVKVPVGSPFLLRAGDVLVAVHKKRVVASVVANGAVGAVPAKSIFVLRLTREARSVLATSFLARLLETNATAQSLKAWTQTSSTRSGGGGRARWITLSAARLTELTIPVPPMPIQARLLRDGTRETFIEGLRTLCRPAEDPVVEWLERSPTSARLAGDPNQQTTGDILAAIVAVRDGVEAQLSGLISPRHEEFLRGLVQVTRALRGVETVSHGWMYLAVLQSARLIAAQHWSEPGQDHTPPQGASFVAAFRSVLGVAVKRCAAAYRVELLRSAMLVRREADAEFTLTFGNTGAIGVHSLQIKGARFTSPTSNLDAGEETSFNISVPCTSDVRATTYVATVTGTRFDGETFDEQLTFTLDLESSVPELSLALDASPYITGASLIRSEMVYGRDPIFDDLARLLASPNAAPLVLLEGNKRVGKTSIMNQLLASRAPAGYVVSYATLQGAEGRSEGAGLTDREVWLHVAHSVADALVGHGLVVPPPEMTLDDKPSAFARKLALRRALSSFITADHPYDAFVTWIELVLEALGELRLLVMIDEFDKLQEGVEAGITSPQLVENLRAMYLQRPRLGFVIAGGRRLARLRTEYFSALFGVGHRITVGPLPEDAARALVTEPVRGQLLWLSDARDEVVRRCARHPFLIQAVCNQVFLRAARENERRIGIAFVEKALDEAVDGMDHFPTLWKQVGTPRRQLLLALCAMDAQSGAARDIGVLEEQLASRGVSVPAEGIGADLAALDELELIRLETEGGYQRYRLRLPIFAAWVQRRDLGALAREACLQDELEEA